MNTVVTGAAGFLGVSVMERLIANGTRKIRCVVRPSTDVRRLDALKARHPEAEICYFNGDLTNPASASRAVEGADVVYHLAAGMKGGYADMFMNSVVASRNLLDGIVANKVGKVIAISSYGVYGVAGLPRGAVVNEETPLEPHPEKRDPYSFAKLRQELLLHEYQTRAGFQLVVLRPGVIYGPGGGAMSTRVGVQFPGFFLNCGGGNLLPLAYVDNCADAVVIAGSARLASNDEVFNVNDDDLPTCGRYLREYKRNVERMPSVRAPYFAIMAMSRLFTLYNKHSNGQLPAFMTTYKSASLWKGNRFDTSKLKGLGWRPQVSIDDGLQRTFAYLKQNRPK